MKIQVNKNQQEINFKKHVWSIIEIAKQKAEIGIERFYYPIPRNQGFSHWELIDKVEEKTEESVYGGYKCIKDGQIKFSIR
tara:strand:+ start:829 stop:1071 length:243 start_codon:yes stop_codon:yes gene_type:complete